MNFRLKTTAAAILAASLVVSYAYASDPTPPAKKHPATRKAATPPGPTVQEQIQAMRQDFQGQIDSLKSNLADKDAQLKQAQQAAADAQAAAAKAQAAADAQQQAATENTAAVSTLQSSVTDLKANSLSLATTVSDETTAIKKAIASPDAINYKGITISPAGSFLEAATVWRQSATGDDINTGASSVPLQNADGAQMSEFFGSARQSRVALKATGKIASMTMTGYYEADWLSSGTTSNNNQSQQLHHAPARTVGRRQDDQRLGFLRRHRLVAGYGNRLGPDPRNPDSAVHHRRAVRCGLRLGAPGKLPREQEHRHEGLCRHVG